MIKTLIDSQARFRPLPLRGMSPEEFGRFAAHFNLAVQDMGRNTSAILRASDAALQEFPDPSGDLGRWLLAWGAWHVWGRKCYFVSPLLSEALEATSLAGMPSETLRTPSPALWVEGNMAVEEDKPPLNGMFLWSEDAKTSWDPETGKSDPARPATRMVNAFAIREKESGGASYSSSIFLCRDSLEESINVSIRYCNLYRAEKGIPVSSRLDDVADRRLWTWAANFLLYLASDRADLQEVLPPVPEKGPVSEKAKARELKRIRKSNGERIAVGYRLQRVAHASPASGPLTSDSARAAVRFHRVSGHHKHQPYGPGLSLRKYIYIMPYWRGDDGSEEHIELIDGIPDSGGASPL